MEYIIIYCIIHNAAFCFLLWFGYVPFYCNIGDTSYDLSMDTL